MPDLPPQGILRFEGLDEVRAFHFPYSHGIQPSVASVEITPQIEVPSTAPASIFLEFGDVSLEFPFCVIDKAAIRRDTNSGMICSVAIKDRRWAWQYGKVSGRYNLRNKDGTVFAPTEKTPQELAEILLDAMGEEEYDVSGLDPRPRPCRNWDNANPARELEQLAEELGCRVVLTLDSTVLIALKGSGSDLPDLPSKRTFDFGIDPPDRPDSLLLVGGTTRYEDEFRLEAVGEDVDGEILPINDLSYMPSAGWGGEILDKFYNVGIFHNNLVPDRSRELAIKTVFRWYRIKCTSPDTTAGVFKIPGYAPANLEDPEGAAAGDVATVEQLWQLLPLEDTRVHVDTDFQPDLYTDNEGVEQPCPAQVFGKWWDESLDDQGGSYPRNYGHGFTIDKERGIVMLSQPAATLTNGTFTEAELYLTVAHPVKNIKTFVEDRWTAEFPVPGEPTGAGPMVLHRDDVVRTSIAEHDDEHQLTDVTNNDDLLQNEANYYFAAAMAEFQSRPTLHVEYAGIVEISPDGAIQQVEWKGNTTTGCTTAAGINAEFSLIVPEYKRRRQKQKVDGMYDATPFGRVPKGTTPPGIPGGRVV